VRVDSGRIPLDFSGSDDEAYAQKAQSLALLLEVLGMDSSFHFGTQLSGCLFLVHALELLHLAAFLRTGFSLEEYPTGDNYLPLPRLAQLVCDKLPADYGPSGWTPARLERFLRMVNEVAHEEFLRQTA